MDEYSILRVFPPSLWQLTIVATLAFTCDLQAVWTPGFVVEPTNKVVQLGGAADFYTEAVIGGEETVSYQWLRDGEPIEGATRQTLQVADVTFAMQREEFRVVAIGSGGGRSTSMVARVVVPNSPPIVVGWPLEMKRHAIAGTNIQFWAGTSGAEPMFYQWYDGANALHGERRNWLMVSNNYSTGPFYAVVSNAFGVATGMVSEVHVSYSMAILRKWETNSVAVIDLAEGPGDEFFSLRENLAQNQQAMPTISRHGTNLEPEWSFQVLSTVRLNAIEADAEGNVYAWGQLAGSFAWGTNQIFPNTSSTQVFLGKVSAAGKALWAVPQREGRMSTAAGLVVRSNEIWTAAATIVDIPNLPSYYKWYPTLRKFNKEGSVEEILSLTNVPPFDRYTNLMTGFEPKRFCELPDGGFVMSGASRYYGPFGILQAGAVVAYDGDGDVRWWAEYASEDQWNETGTVLGMAVDESGNTYVSGKFGNRSGAFLSKLGPDGTELWRELARTDYWQTGSGVYPWTLEGAPNGNIRMAGLARYIGTGGYFLGGDYLPELPFVHEFTPDGELVNTTYFELKQGDFRDTDTLDMMTRGGEVLVGGRVRAFQNARGFIAEMGYLKEPVSTNAATHLIFWEAVGGTIRPRFTATGPAAFEWHRDGQIMPNDNFSYLSLSPAELERAADYTLFVQTLGGAVTTAPVSVGNARMVREPLGIEVHSPSGARFEVRARNSLGVEETWLAFTNVTSVGVPVVIPFSAAREKEFFRINPK